MKFKTLGLFALLSFTYQLQAMPLNCWKPEEPTIDIAINKVFKFIFDISEEIITIQGYPGEKKTISAKFPNYIFRQSQKNTEPILTLLVSPEGKKFFFIDKGNNTWIIPEQSNNNCPLPEINNLQAVLASALAFSHENEVIFHSFSNKDLFYTISRSEDNSIILERFIQPNKQ